MRLTLTLFDPTALSGGPTVSRSFDQSGGTIGRAAGNDWVLTDPLQHLSEQHCRIEWRDGSHALVDTSATGVYLNESTEALGFGHAATLHPGDRIALGDYLIAVSFDDGAPDAAADPGAVLTQQPASEPTPASAFGGAPDMAPADEPGAHAHAGDPPSSEPAPTAIDALAPNAPPSEMPVGLSAGISAERRADPEDRLPSSSATAPRETARDEPDILTLDQRAPAASGARGRAARAGSRRAPRGENGQSREPGGRTNDYVAAFLSAAGVRAPDLSRDQALQLMSRAGEGFREAIVGMHAVARRRTGGLRDRLVTSDDNPLTAATDADAAVASLLGLKGPTRLPPDRAIREVVAAFKAPGITALGATVESGFRWRREATLAAVGALILLVSAAAYYELGRASRGTAVPPPAVEAAIAPSAMPATAPTSPPAVTLPAVAPPVVTLPVVTPPAIAPQPQPAAALAPAPPAIDRARLRDGLAQLFRGFVCADLGAEVAGDGAVTLTGFVSRGDDLVRLHREVSGLPDVARVDSRATVEPWPFCEVTKLLKAQTAGGVGAPQIEPSHADRVYHEGDALVVTATPRAAGDGFLYVDFFDTDGKVVHMLPSALRANNRVAANERVALGTDPAKAGRNDRVYIISPPFGTGVVIALSTARPLFAELRPEQEDAGAYLAALAGALVRDPVGGGSAARITSSQQAITLVAR